MNTGSVFCWHAVEGLTATFRSFLIWPLSLYVAHCELIINYPHEGTYPVETKTTAAPSWTGRLAAGSPSEAGVWFPHRYWGAPLWQ